MPGAEFTHQDGKFDASFLVLNGVGKLDGKADTVDSHQPLTLFVSTIDSVNRLDNLLD